MYWLVIAQEAAQHARRLTSAVEHVAPPGGTTTYGTKLDWIVIFTYLVLILGFGSFFGRFAKSTRDFFFSGARFSWWLIGMSMVATGVGSHSFIKYAQVGYEHGLSSSMSYMNDWFFIPLFMFGWLPIIYFSRVRSIPEYFSRRFNEPARFLAVLVILEYMIGYVGFNLFMLGTAAHQVLGINVQTAIVAIALISGMYVTAGGQTAVIFTDLAQGFMLLFAGMLLFVLGLDALAFDGTIVTGIKTLWATLPLDFRLPFAHFNEPQSFNFIGVFWQDGITGSMTFLFISQGVIMRFLAGKSVNEGRKAILFNTAFILPISMIVVGNAGWIGRAMVDAGMIDAPPTSKEAFVKVAEIVCHPGVFGFVLAALSAALMSTIDTLTNATAALFIYDVYQPYLARNKPDRHYMSAARWATACAAAVGLGIALWFSTFGSDLYKIHGMFQAFITPPIVAAVVLGAFWKRYTSWGAVGTLAGGIVAMFASKQWPWLVKPFAHGVAPDAEGQYTFMTACFGLAAAAAIGIVVSLVTRPKTDAQLAGLWIGSVELGRRLFKGAAPNDRVGRPVKNRPLVVTADGTTPSTIAMNFREYQAEFSPPVGDHFGAGSAAIDTAARAAPPSVATVVHDETHAYPIVRVTRADMEQLAADPGDLLYISDNRWWLGGLRSLHCRAGAPLERDEGVWIHPQAFDDGSFLPGRRVRVEKIL